MLIEFKVKNYKSFAEEATFSMVAAPKQKGLDYSLLQKKVKVKVDGKDKSKIIKGLCSSVIYGPNASGKTNIIGAMETLKAIVLRGDIKNRNPEKESSPNAASFNLEIIPNNQVFGESLPVEFSIEFLQNDLLINYAILIDLGTFGCFECTRSIISENLTVNGEVVFTRKNNILTLVNLDVINEYISDSAKQKDVVLKIANESLRSEELFLTNGFKFIFSVKFAELIIDWFENKLKLIYRADTIEIRKEIENPQKNHLYLENSIKEAIRLFGAKANDIGYKRVSDNDSNLKLCSLYNMKNGRSFIVPAEFIESYGTIRFINLFPLVLGAIENGSALVVDEFDASIHPMALMSIINIFHNDDINVNHAQLIFNTHNPIFLNSSLFRRDEIKFVERDDNTHFSTLYSLSDFGTTGEKGVRKHEDYMKNYFVSQYGAIKDIDFTPIFEGIKNKGV